MTGRFKTYFLRGLAVLVPTIVTIWIFVWGYNFIQNKISIHINRALVWLTIHFKGQSWDNPAVREQWNDFWINGWGSVAGFIIALIAVCVLGAILASVVGRTLWRYTEKLITNMPVVRRIYPYIKQVTDLLLIESERKKDLFLRVVAVEYPGEGLWSLGFVTSAGLRKVTNNQGKEFLTVLVPTSPTPFTGFIVLAPKEKTIDLDMKIEEAFRFIISGGMVTPPGNEGITVLPAAEAIGKV